MNNNINKDLFSQRLKELMKNYNETTYSLGEIVKLSPPTISRYTRGQMIPKMTTIQAFAKHFNVSPDWLAGNSNSIIEDEILEETTTLTSVPIFESIKYDLPIFSNNKIEPVLDIPIKILSRWGAVIGYKINDDVMSPYLKKGDFVIIKLGNVDLPNKFVALHVNESDLLIRKVIPNKGMYILQPADLNYDAQICNQSRDNIQIIGSVVYVHREKNTILE